MANQGAGGSSGQRATARGPSRQNE